MGSESVAPFKLRFPMFVLIARKKIDMTFPILSNRTISIEFAKKNHDFREEKNRWKYSDELTLFYRLSKAFYSGGTVAAYLALVCSSHFNTIPTLGDVFSKKRRLLDKPTWPFQVWRRCASYDLHY